MVALRSVQEPMSTCIELGHHECERYIVTVAWRSTCFERVKEKCARNTAYEHLYLTSFSRQSKVTMQEHAISLKLRASGTQPSSCTHGDGRIRGGG